MMEGIINIDDMFFDTYRAVVLCEYERELSLLRRIISLADEALQNQRPCASWGFDEICYLFARSVIDYAKMAYDNLLMGHFDATYMLYRTMIENNVCLDIILSDEKEELWKYYLVQSYRSDMMKGYGNLTRKNMDFLEKMYREYGIDKEFYEKRENKKPYIDIRYGWTYKINKRFTIEGLCELVNKSDYDDFKMMSEYVHGTSIYVKINSSVFVGQIFNMISSIYIGIYRLVTMYCEDEIDEEFYELADEIEYIIYNYIDSKEWLEKEELDCH